jgi:hypothetical protein
MQSMICTRYDPEPDAASPTRWQVGYDVVLDSGRLVYPVTTVYRSQVEDTEQATVLAEAASHVLPGIATQEQVGSEQLPA